MTNQDYECISKRNRAITTLVWCDLLSEFMFVNDSGFAANAAGSSDSNWKGWPDSTTHHALLGPQPLAVLVVIVTILVVIIVIGI